MEIRRITAQEVWPLRHQVMWPDLPFDFIKLPEDSNAKHFGLFLELELISVVSIFKKEAGVAQFRKFATKTEQQGKGYGSKLLLHLIDFVKEQGYHTLWCNARLDKTDYYKKFGMIETDQTFVKKNIKFVILKKVL